MKIKRSFINDGSRYTYDTGMCSPENGFAQVDTRQDAWYYGCWANPVSLQVVSYCEGDFAIEQCETKEEFVDRLRCMKDSPDFFKGIDCMCREEIVSAFTEIGLADLLH